jgi:Xaa-Pro aminopeptidase
MTTNNRLTALRDLLKKEGFSYEGVFITRPENRAYFSGFTGSFGYLLITATEAILFTDGRYIEQAALQAPGWKVVRLQRPFEQNVIPEIKRLGLASIGFEADHLSYNDYTSWTEKIKETQWLPAPNLGAKLRQRKDSVEVEALRRAVDIASQAFDRLLGLLKPGMTERDAAAELEYGFRKFGADSVAFDTIVASGPRGALPHGRATAKVIEAGELVTFDFGARIDGYNSDITRTVFVGGDGKQPSERQRQIYNLVLESQMAGVEAVKPGVNAGEIDKICRDIFEKAGLVEYYMHSTGHNLGREVHEAPFLMPNDPNPLEAGMVLTVEPGLYFPEWGGVRIEDDLLVTANGAEILPRLTKELILL